MIEKRSSLKLTKKLTVVPFILSFILLPVFFLGIFWFLVLSHEKTDAKYDELMASAGIKKEEKKEGYQINQERQYVQKDITFLKKGQELHFRLLADKTKFIFDHQNSKTEMAEHMKNVTCYMQEELYYLLPDGREVLILEGGILELKENGEKILDAKELKPMQTMRKMEAEEGIYYYKSDLFMAKNVKIERFLAEGHELLNQGLEPRKIMSGVADSVQFCFKEKNLDFKANNLKAKFYEPWDGS